MLRLFATIAALMLVPRAGRAIGASEEPLDIETWRRASAVYAIAQATDGFLWIGTQAGLSRFDGNRFVDFDAQGAPGLGDDHARLLLAGRDGSLWIATGGGFISADAPDGRPVLDWSWGKPGLVRMSGGTFARMGVRDGLPSEWVQALAQDPAGAVWIGTTAGLCRWKDGRIEGRPLLDPLPDPLVTALLAHADGTLSVGTGAGLVRLRGGRIEKTSVTAPVFALAGDRAGRTWVSTPGKLIGLGEGRAREIPTPKTALALWVDRDGRLWVGSEAGLSVLEEASDGSATLSPRLGGRIVAIAEDREGSLWAGTRTNGLSQLRVPQLRNVGVQEGLGGEMAFSVLAARDGSVWLTATGGVVSRWTREGIRSFKRGIDFDGRDLRSLAEGRDGSIWISTREVGLLRYRDGRFTRFGVADGLRSEKTEAVHVDAHGRLWVTWSSGGVTRYDDGSLAGKQRTFTEADGICPGVAHALDGRSGRLWLATPSGLGLIEGDRGRCHTVRDGLPENGIAALHEEQDGTVWLGVDGFTGLVRFKEGRFVAIPASAGLPASGRFRITEDTRGYLWVTSSVGVWRAAKSELAAYAGGAKKRVDVLLFDSRDGMRSQECTAATQPASAWDADGRLWVATLAGATVFPEPESRPRPLGRPIVDRIAVDGVVRPSEGPLSLPRGGGDLELQFTAPSFLAPHRLQFWYRLEGLDRDWIAAEGRRSARYAGLSPGAYSFRVRARDSLGRTTGEDAAIAVRVPPRFHQTGWFVAACAALLAAAGLGLHLLRVRRINAQHAALQAERSRIARDLHDSLAQGLSAIGLHLDGLRLGLDGPAAPLRELLEQTRQVVDRCQVETRRSIWDIRLGSEGPSLKALLTNATASLSIPPGMELAVRASGSPRSIPGFLQNELTRIVQEAVVNAVRHSGAKQVLVDGEYDGEGLRLAVRDDGRGFSAEPRSPAVGGGAGLLGMRERAGRIGGTLVISSSPDMGTEVRLAIPEAELKSLSRKQIP